MPPKQQPNKKSQEKVKTKIIEDKTFGLKNKKGAKQQKFIAQVQKQVQNKFQPRDNLTAEEKERKKAEEKQKKDELAALFKPVLTQQQVAKGVDPKSVVCVYFKQGLCQKGDKCKFSHDLSVERKAEKRNIYEDCREQTGMESWDDAQLEDVVNKRHGEDNQRKIQTQIVCKYFIEAVEKKTYGWFWNCPNGENCMYRHALPPGFTLKSDEKKKEEGEKISLEMLIEKERASLGSKADFKLGFVNGLTGRDIFTFNPDMIANEEDYGEDVDYRQRADEEDESGEKIMVREINAEFFAMQAKEADNTGTLATDDRFDYLKSIEKEKQEDDKLDMACGGGDDEEEKNVEIDESLFNADELQDLDEELENLEV
ncbi:zinc finger CCCH domain-containing [Brachionus plicatilis]|uniref:Zinc finger CCCH domain-containing n=1 Tax=Brachionus plicatilis TaxID=10195 RepID=A0A3M7SLB2_BRAPC|nr:zinc finger CCCH domain-containing [Brachionus plicatilis]